LGAVPGNTKPRKRKHRGTQTGKVDTRGRTGRPRSRQEAMARAKRSGRGQRVDRRMIPPTWRGATIRGCFFAALLFPVSMLFGQPASSAAVLAIIAAFFYVPLGFYTDRFFYRRRMARLQRARAAEKEQKAQRGKQPAGKS
jgi:hypothetical protein